MFGRDVGRFVVSMGFKWLQPTRIPKTKGKLINNAPSIRDQLINYTYASPFFQFSWLKFPESVPVSRVKQASLGLRHLAIVTEDGKIFVSGSGSKGQLGIVDSYGRPFSELQTLTQGTQM